MLSLEQQRSDLQQQLDSLTKQLGDLSAHIFDESAPSVKAPAANGTPAPKAVKTVKKARKGTKRGELTAAILDGLKTAGTVGITVADLAKKLGANYKNIYIWFATTGKKHPVKKLAPATYSLS
jgi:hypothetical protein